MTQSARFSGTARREFAKVLRDMEHAAAAQRLRDVVELAARLIGERPCSDAMSPRLPTLAIGSGRSQGFLI